MQLLSVIGEIDYLTLQLLERVLTRGLAKPARKVVLDLARTEFLDPTALSLVVEAAILPESSRSRSRW